MRLIDTATLELQDFPFGNVPPYATLSHTWGAEEVTFQEMSSGAHQEKRGFKKILETCRLARNRGLEFAWVDTCCIDKSSSAELTESINSMFNWYKESKICYVYLEDLGPDDLITKLRNCRWITRGWTLQELIAPKNLELYDSEWNYRGTKTEHAKILSDYTGVPRSILIGKGELQDCSVAARMSWIAHRQTTRTEDIAYCMLGIFKVNMPLLYGEGLMAFRRLQEEILRRNNDMTILAWGRQPQGKTNDYKGVLAESPAEFLDSGSITPFWDDSDSISITNKGLLVSGDIPIRVVVGPGGNNYQYMLCLGNNLKREYRMEGLILRKIGPNSFCRIDVGCLPGPCVPTQKSDMALFQQEFALDYNDFYLLIDPKGPIARASRYRERGVHMAPDPMMSIVSATPQALWDVTDRVFLREKPYRWHHPVPRILGLLVDYTIDGHPVELMVLCDYETARPKCGLRLQSKCPRNLLRAFDKSNIVNSIVWPDTNENTGERKEGHRSIDVCIGGRFVRISIMLEEEHQESQDDEDSQEGGQDDVNSFSEHWMHRWVVRLGWHEIDGDESTEDLVISSTDVPEVVITNDG